VWTAGTIRFGETDPETGRQRTEFEAEGLTLGADIRLNPNFGIGIGIGYGSDTVDVGSNGSRSKTEATTLAVYASHLLGGGYFADWVAGYQSLDVDLRRYVTSTRALVNASRGGDQWFVSATAGADVERGKWVLSPYGRLDISRGTLDGYAERSGSPFDLAFGEQEVNFTAVGVGARAQYTHLFEGGSVRPSFSVEYLYDVERSANARVAYTDRVSGPFSSIALTGFDREELKLGAGLEVDWGTLAVQLDYLNRFARVSGSDQSLQLTVRYAF
jgi:outer membrane autotransporter protein